MTQRFAIIDDERAVLETVRDYLPANYTARRIPTHGRILVEGVDDHGWTLDGYVLPRLLSGLIGAREVDRRGAMVEILGDPA